MAVVRGNLGRGQGPQKAQWVLEQGRYVGPTGGSCSGGEPRCGGCEGNRHAEDVWEQSNGGSGYLSLEWRFSGAVVNGEQCQLRGSL